MVPKDSYISNINGVLNAIILDGKPIGRFTIQGEGAGPGPTTSSLVSDICSILRGNIKLPFSIRLNDFIAEKYPGTEKSYSSFMSRVTVESEDTFDYDIYMNNI